MNDRIPQSANPEGIGKFDLVRHIESGRIGRVARIDNLSDDPDNPYVSISLWGKDRDERMPSGPPHRFALLEKAPRDTARRIDRMTDAQIAAWLFNWQEEK